MDQPTATFTCATIAKSTTTLLGLPGGGTLATVSFTVTSDNNGTSVRCAADDGIDFQLTPMIYAYGQGTFIIRIILFISKQVPYH